MFLRVQRLWSITSVSSTDKSCCATEPAAMVVRFMPAFDAAVFFGPLRQHHLRKDDRRSGSERPGLTLIRVLQLIIVVFFVVRAFLLLFGGNLTDPIVP